MPGKTKIVGIWNWLFTDAGAVMIVKYEVILESLHPRSPSQPWMEPQSPELW